MNNISENPPKWFWAVGILALFWNMIGIIAFISELYMTDAELSGLSEAEQHFHTLRPSWVQIVYAMAVFTGVSGCIALLARKVVASRFLVLSLIGLTAKSFYIFVISDAVSLFGMNQLIMPIFVLIIGILLVVHVHYCKANGWLT